MITVSWQALPVDLTYPKLMMLLKEVMLTRKTYNS